MSKAGKKAWPRKARVDTERKGHKTTGEGSNKPKKGHEEKVREIEGEAKQEEITVWE